MALDEDASVMTFSAYDDILLIWFNLLDLVVTFLKLTIFWVSMGHFRSLSGDDRKCCVIC